jgi:hypothetical protein
LSSILATFLNLFLIYVCTQICVTEIAYDFIPLKADLGQQELLRHMTVHSYSTFKKDAVVNGQTPEEMPKDIQMQMCPENYKERLYALRKFVLELGRAYIEEYFVSQFQKTYPDFTYGNGLTVQSSANMVRAYSNENCSNEMREMVYYCMNGMWEGNGWASRIENKIMNVLQLRYTSKFGTCKVQKEEQQGKYLYFPLSPQSCHQQH